MDRTAYPAATRPTLHFVGVTTSQSSILRAFPAWAAHLGLGDAVISGIDLPLHAEPTRYRAVVTHLRDDPLSLGALVTTHKLDLYAAAADLFDEIDPHARAMAETSCLSKRGGRLVCHAKDPISSGLALDGLLSPGHFADTGAEALLIGAGGAATAITWHLMVGRTDRPARLVVTDRDPHRLDELRRFHAGLDGPVATEYRLAATAAVNDAALAGLPPGSLVINATGLGKDAPGSPLSDAAVFPREAVVWELNYRGDLVFLAQARRQAAARSLRVEDGWDYFVHGWTQVIGEVFGVAIATDGPAFDALSAIARGASAAR